MAKEGMVLFIYVVLFFVFLGSVRMIFNLNGNLFLSELFFIVLMLLLVLSTMIGIYKEKDWAWSAMFVIIGLLTINILYVYQNVRQGFVTTAGTALFGLIGFYGSLVNLGPTHEVKLPELPKYVASETGKKFHSPECKWAEKINNKVWFQSENEAKAQGYKPCNCI